MDDGGACAVSSGRWLGTTASCRLTRAWWTGVADVCEGWSTRTDDVCVVEEGENRSRAKLSIVESEHSMQATDPWDPDHPCTHPIAQNRSLLFHSVLSPSLHLQTLCLVQLFSSMQIFRSLVTRLFSCNCHRRGVY